MKLKFNSLLIAGLVCIFSSCSQQKPNDETTAASPENKLEKIKWLLGNWGNSSAEGTVCEFWNLTNDSTWSGNGYFIKEKDTLSKEILSLELRMGKLFYIPSVNNQNGGLPVSFKEKTLSDSLIVFENPEHDFPQFITYRLIRSDSIVAEISGKIKGEAQSQVFAYSKK